MGDKCKHDYELLETVRIEDEVNFHLYCRRCLDVKVLHRPVTWGCDHTWQLLNNWRGKDGRDYFTFACMNCLLFTTRYIPSEEEMIKGARKVKVRKL